MKRMHAIAAGVVAAATLGLVVAQAQPFGGPGAGYGPGMMGPGAGYGPGMMGRGPRGAYGDPTAAAQARLTNLHTQLGITSAQESAWQAFANAVTEQAQQMQQFRSQMLQSGTTLTTPDRMTQHAQFMQQRAQGASTVAQAMTALYAALSPDQRTLLDQSFPARRGNGPFGG